MKKLVLSLMTVCTILICSCTQKNPSTETKSTVSGWTEADGSRSYYVNGVPLTGWQFLDGKTVYFSDEGILCIGWLEVDGNRYFLDENGTPSVGWQTIDDKLYYFTDDGILHTGWLEWNEHTYYFLENGTLARGQVTIDDTDHFFTSSGCQILLVNPWHAVPEAYEPDLITVDNTYLATSGTQVDQSCYDALLQMVTDCNEKSGARVYIVSSYRTMEHQTRIFNRKVNEWKNQGYDEETAKKKAETSVAIPGTSEHQLGLAVDIVDTQSWKLTASQDTFVGQQWLMEHCWEYGFILRYPESKIDVTGIIYEPWHYRYVGKELAIELRDTNLTLEEYFSALSNAS